MRRAIALFLILAMAVPLFAVEGQDVAYVGGTIVQIKPDTIGRFDMTREHALVYTYEGGSLEIPYEKIESYNHTAELAVHLGVAATIAVALVKHLRRRHFMRIIWRGADGSNQVAVFEISKTMPRLLVGVLTARAPKPCKPATPLPSAATASAVQR